MNLWQSYKFIQQKNVSCCLVPSIVRSKQLLLRIYETKSKIEIWQQYKLTITKSLLVSFHWLSVIFLFSFAVLLSVSSRMNLKDSLFSGIVLLFLIYINVLPFNLLNFFIFFQSFFACPLWEGYCVLQISKITLLT